MKCLLFRTCSSGSLPVQTPSPRFASLPVQDSLAFPKNKIILTEMSRRSIRRASSESDLLHSSPRSFSSNLGSRSFTAPRLIEGVRGGEEEDDDDQVGGKNNNNNNNKSRNFPGGGNERADDQCRMGLYYQEMLRKDPTNALLLRNYGKYLHEVEKDLGKAEEYYGRAILASPGDGEVLWLYAKLTWESSRDKARAKCYFSQALQASPNDCTILGSYAHFLWEAEEEEEEEEEDIDINREALALPALMVEAL